MPVTTADIEPVPLKHVALVGVSAKPKASGCVMVCCVVATVQPAGVPPLAVASLTVIV